MPDAYIGRYSARKSAPTKLDDPVFAILDEATHRTLAYTRNERDAVAIVTALNLAEDGP